eukprot:TRINITY_DN77217_c0_g1_i1.p1 TRINITY_DN77217_c0_g1~~TRINITY_DN77217_c0_g1_i1.p1  ORF type:complete len:666 (-),score=120.48 TRINITY_DN77217_c0_g1_i1:68-2065(-)
MLHVEDDDDMEILEVKGMQRGVCRSNAPRLRSVQRGQAASSTASSRVSAAKKTSKGKNKASSSSKPDISSRPKTQKPLLRTPAEKRRCSMVDVEVLETEGKASSTTATVLSSGDEEDGVQSQKTYAPAARSAKNKKRLRLRTKPKILARKHLRQACQIPPIALDIEDEDRVIETCQSYEEAFFGAGSALGDRVGVMLRGSFASARDTSPTPKVQERKSSPPPARTPVINASHALQRRAQLPEESSTSAPSLSSSAAPVDIVAAIEPVCLPGTLPLLIPGDVPAAPPGGVPEQPGACQEPSGNICPFEGDDPELFLPTEHPELSLPTEHGDVLCEVYVERLRVNSLAERCCACWQFFSPGQLRLGYVPSFEAADGGLPAARWLHAPRCLTSDGLRIDPSRECVAFGPRVSEEEMQHILAVLGLLSPWLPARDAEHPVLRPRPWHYGPALAQRWDRRQIFGPGMPRPMRASTEYVAPELSAAAREARLMLAVRGRSMRQLARVRRALHEPLEDGPDRAPRVADRTAPDQPRAGGRRHAARGIHGGTARGRRAPATQAPQPGRRVVSQRVLGGLTKELRRAAPVVVLKQDMDSDEPCVICHETLMAGEEVRRLPCFHTFHRACIDRWLRVKAVCPLDKLTVDELLAPSRAAATSSRDAGAAWVSTRVP